MTGDLISETPRETLSPEALVAQAMAFQNARLILAGLEVGLFDLLRRGPAREVDIRDHLGLHQRGTGHFLEALVALGVLECDGEGFRNGAAVEASLLADSPVRFDGFLYMAGTVMFPAWAALPEGLRSGEPQAITYSSGDMFSELYSDRGKRENLVRMAEDASRPLVPALLRTFDWSSVSTVVELGGCRGAVLAEILEEYPHLTGTVVDLPQLQPAFEEHVASLGVRERISFFAGDFFTDRLPRADVVMIGHAFIDWDQEQRRVLLDNALRSVAAGGAFLIWDPIIIPGRESHLRNLVRSLNLQLMTPHGGGYTLEQCEQWLRAAGCADVTTRELGHDVTLVIAGA